MYDLRPMSDQQSYKKAVPWITCLDYIFVQSSIEPDILHNPIIYSVLSRTTNIPSID